MLKSRLEMPRLFGLGIILICATYSIVVSASPPAPIEITEVCVESSGKISCQQPLIEEASGNGKYPAKVRPANFNPGFYAYQNGDNISGLLNSIDGVSAFAGVVRGYEWSDLETAKNTYDFSKINKDIAALSSKGLQLIILVRMKRFNAGEPYTPGYMHRDQSYGGGPKYYGVFPGKTNASGIVTSWLPAVWNSNVLSRIDKLYAALGAKYANNTTVEGVFLHETAWRGPVAKTYSGYTMEKWLNGFKSMALSAKAAFPQKSVLQAINYSNFDVLEFADWCVDNGIGLAGPDIALGPDYGGLASYYAKYSEHHNTVPSAPNVQWHNYTRATVKEMYDFVIDELNPWYSVWQIREPYFSQEVIPLIKKNGQLPAAATFYN